MTDPPNEISYLGCFSMLLHLGPDQYHSAFRPLGCFVVFLPLVCPLPLRLADPAFCSVFGLQAYLPFCI